MRRGIEVSETIIDYFTFNPLRIGRPVQFPGHRAYDDPMQERCVLLISDRRERADRAVVDAGAQGDDAGREAAEDLSQQAGVAARCGSRGRDADRVGQTQSLASPAWLPCLREE